MTNQQNYFLPPCILWTSLSHRGNKTFLWMGIGQATLISPSHYSYPFPCNNKIVEKWLMLHKYGELP